MDKKEVLDENIKTIYKLASSFYGAEKEDLIQAGIVGLYKALENYKPNETCKFSTYAYNYIFGEMYLFVNKNKALKISKDTLKMYKYIEKVRFELAQEKGYVPSNYELSSIINLDVNTIDFACNCAINTLSLESENESDRSLYETISKDETITQDDKLMLYSGLENLSNDQRVILEERYFNDETQANVARKLKMTQVMVSRLEKKAVNNMREYMMQ